MNENENVVDLGIVLKRLYRWRYPIIVLASALIALLYFNLRNQQPRYLAESKIIYQSESRSVSGSMGALAAFAGISLGGNSNDMANYLPDIIYSRDLLTTIARTPWKSSKLSADTSLAQTLDKWWKIKIDTTQPDSKEFTEEIVVATLASQKFGYIRFEKDPKSGIIKLSTEFEDPRISTDINQFLVNTLNDYVLHKMHFKASQNTEFISNRMKEAKQDLARAENAYYAFRKSNFVRNDPMMSLEEERYQRNLAISQEMYLQFLKQYEMARIEELKESPVLDVLETAIRPRFPSRPNKKLYMAVGIPASFLLSILLFHTLAVLLEWRSRLRGKR